MSPQKLIWALNRLSGFGIQTFKRLQDQTVYFAQLEEIEQLNVLKHFLDPDSFARLGEILAGSDFERELDQCHSKQVQLITILDPSYPKNLLSIYDPPFLLYVKGTLTADDELAIAMVGSRRPSLYGLRMANRFASELTERGITIISGFARGIDGEAHRAALKAQGRTIGVLGCGVDILYPKENRKLYDEISEKGALVSEFPLGTEPETYHFPKRNRIISGLSLGVLVVEAGQKSGSLITASLAAEEGREVYAIPGPIDSNTSQGTNHLIQNGAKLVLSVDDIFVDLKHQMKAILNPTPNRNVSASPDLSEPPLLRLLSKEPLSFDEITDMLGQNPKEIHRELIDLELKGTIRRVFGGKFVRSQELAMT